MKPKYEPKTVAQTLGYLIEECGEVLAATGKTIRWGVDSANPDIRLDHRESNRDWILRELKDLEGAVMRAREALDVPMPDLLTRIGREECPS